MYFGLRMICPWTVVAASIQRRLSLTTIQTVIRLRLIAISYGPREAATLALRE
jgi:hypothetical protein